MQDSLNYDRRSLVPRDDKQQEYLSCGNIDELIFYCFLYILQFVISERSEESPIVDKCVSQKTQKVPNRITER